MTRRLIIVCGLLAVHAGIPNRAEAAPAELPTPGPVVNIVEWDGNQLPTVYERSDQLPIDQEALLELSRNGFQPLQLVEIVTQRRYAGDVSAAGMIALKEAGVSQEVIRAASLHALAPNRFVNLTITMEIDGTTTTPRSRYLYLVVLDGEIERVFTADLGTVFSGRWQNETQVDLSDLLIPRTIRTVTFSGKLPLKSAEEKTMTIFTSTRPDIHWLTDLSEDVRTRARAHTFDYPASSTVNDCRLLIRLYQDRMLEDNWNITGTHLECEWN